MILRICDALEWISKYQYIILSFYELLNGFSGFSGFSCFSGFSILINPMINRRHILLTQKTNPKTVSKIATLCQDTQPFNDPY